MENVDGLREWLSKQAAKSPFLPNQVIVRKYLAPGTVMDLHEHYKATQAMVGANSVSPLGCFTFKYLFGKCCQMPLLSPPPWVQVLCG